MKIISTVINEKKFKKIETYEDGRVRVSSWQPTDLRTITQQQFKAECDPNVLMKKYRYSQLPSPQGIYLDTTSLPDLKSALDTVREAHVLFNSLPSDVRFRFGNDPEYMIKFVQDPQNKEESIKLGLIKKPEPVVVDKMDTLIDVVKSAQRQNTPSKKSNQKNDPDDL